MRPTKEERHRCLTTLTRGQTVDCADPCLPSVGVDGIASRDWARRYRLIDGAGDELVPGVRPIMPRRLLHRATSSSLLFYDWLEQQVDGELTSSCSEWEAVCSTHEWAHFMAQSLRSSVHDEYWTVALASLLGAHSSYCGSGWVLKEVLVDASHARSGWSCHSLQTLVCWKETPKEESLLDKAWLLTEGALWRGRRHVFLLRQVLPRPVDRGPACRGFCGPTPPRTRTICH